MAYSSNRFLALAHFDDDDEEEEDIYGDLDAGEIEDLAFLAGAGPAPVHAIPAHPALGLPDHEEAPVLPIHEDAPALPVEGPPQPDHEDAPAPLTPLDNNGQDDDPSRPWKQIPKSKTGRTGRRVPAQDVPAPAPKPCIEVPWVPKTGSVRAVQKHAQARKGGYVPTDGDDGVYVYGSFGPDSLEYY